MRHLSRFLLLCLPALLTVLSAPAQAQRAFDPNLVTCAEVLRSGEDLMELTTLFTYSFLSGLDYCQGMPVSPLDKDTFASTQAAVQNLCEKHPEYTILRMIGAGLEGKPSTEPAQ